MSDNVQDITSRLKAKMAVVAERQALLVSRIEEERAEAARLRTRVNELTAEVAKLKADVEYLTVMRAVAPTASQVEQGRARLAGLVREIDRCIAELKAC